MILDYDRYNSIRIAFGSRTSHDVRSVSTHGPTPISFRQSQADRVASVATSIISRLRRALRKREVTSVGPSREKHVTKHCQEKRRHPTCEDQHHLRRAIPRVRLSTSQHIRTDRTQRGSYLNVHQGSLPRLKSLLNSETISGSIGRYAGGKDGGAMALGPLGNLDERVEYCSVTLFRLWD